MSLEGLEENIASLKQLLQVPESCELIPGPLGEQQTHLTTETSFQPPYPMPFENHTLWFVNRWLLTMHKKKIKLLRVFPHEHVSWQLQQYLHTFDGSPSKKWRFFCPFLGVKYIQWLGSNEYYTQRKIRNLLWDRMRDHVLSNRSRLIFPVLSNTNNMHFVILCDEMYTSSTLIVPA